MNKQIIIFLFWCTVTETIKRQNVMLENQNDTIWLTFLTKRRFAVYMHFSQLTSFNENGKKQFML